jgi:hypothetical protein
LTTISVFAIVSSPAAAAALTSSAELSTRGVLPSAQVTLLTAQSGL